MQLKMNFTDTNPLRERLESAEFVFLLEYELPAEDENLSVIYENVNGICEYVKGAKEIVAISLTDRMESLDSIDALDLASKISARSGKAPIIHVSGKGYDKDSLKDRLAAISSEGLSNILAVSGDYSSDLTKYTDSVDIIRESKKTLNKALVGAAVNPYKYTVNDSYGQYLKMLRKINAGADYIVTHVGWDMKKLQELLLFSRMREINIPMIARLSLITEDDSRKLTDLSLHKGVSVSREFASQIQRELASTPQFMTTQLKRLCLQIAGCSLMGYSGVQICGLKTSDEVKTVMETAQKLLSEFRTFTEWANEWKQFHHGVEMVTPPYTFYMFRNLMKFKTTYEIEGEFRLAEASFTESTFTQRMKQKLASALTVENKGGISGKFLRSVLTGSSEEPAHDLRKTQYLSLNQCPKKLYHGPCGGSQLNGDCEVGKGVCIHNLRISLAAENNELDKLEDPNE
ncbi:MAG: methylenetetrahydrofolate reductase C-terminal domain-containing protein [Lentisphaeraceae bacterium]|nr:methylenetetrahydrofolate reductase C-terminal domain-containing protein [Lentisphaeraceae bacterium]